MEIYNQVLPTRNTPDVCERCAESDIATIMEMWRREGCSGKVVCNPFHARKKQSNQPTLANLDGDFSQSSAPGL